MYKSPIMWQNYAIFIEQPKKDTENMAQKEILCNFAAKTYIISPHITIYSAGNGIHYSYETLFSLCHDGNCRHLVIRTASHL